VGVHALIRADVLIRLNTVILAVDGDNSNNSHTANISYRTKLNFAI